MSHFHHGHQFWVFVLRRPSDGSDAIPKKCDGTAEHVERLNFGMNDSICETEIHFAGMDQGFYCVMGPSSDNLLRRMSEQIARWLVFFTKTTLHTLKIYVEYVLSHRPYERDKFLHHSA